MSSLNTVSKSNRYWRSLGQLQETPEFREWMHREFPVAASEFPNDLSRRRWMQLMGASLALGGLAGCRWEAEQFAPFAIRPENRIPGEPEFHATSLAIGDAPRHLLATSYDGRPIKLEGNEQHPGGQRGTDAWTQASILGLYDPDRSAQVSERIDGQIYPRTWAEFDAFAARHTQELAGHGGSGLSFLLEPSSSASIDLIRNLIRKRFPQATLHQFSALDRHHELAGAELAWEQPLRTRWDLRQARIIVALDCDLLGTHPDSLRLTRDYSANRAPQTDVMNRLYSVESQFTVTGAAADHRLAIPSHDIGRVAAYLLTCCREQLGLATPGEQDFGLSVGELRTLNAAVSDLVAHRGRSVIAVGASQPAEVHALVHTLNDLLDNFGSTTHLTVEPSQPRDTADLMDLAERMRRGRVNTLVIVGGNPVFNAPGDVALAEAMRHVPVVIRLGLYDDETSALCHWHLPEAHAFEAWGDVRSWDGTLSVSQPLIEPLCNGRSALELLAQLCGDPRTPRQLVRDAIERAGSVALSDSAWRRVLHDGYLPSSELTSISRSSLASGPSDEHVAAWSAAVSQRTRIRADQEVEAVWTLGQSVHDGRFANNGWLQEMPDAITKLTWDNALLISPATAERWKVEHGTIVRLIDGDQQLELPAYVLPGQADGSVGIALGYGRTRAGLIGGDQNSGVASVGVNANPLRRWASRHIARGLRLAPTGKPYLLATTQEHHAVDTVGMNEIGRRVGELVRETTLDHSVTQPQGPHAQGAHGNSHHDPLGNLWKETSSEGSAWGMAIDLNKCIGCNACLMACQAENNVPIVGKEQVAKGREMHWIRLDRYFQGEIEDPRIVTQPVTCHHCENAPCEQVCPVAATVHSSEGLNDMVYNRCIGTRYCANNCPYKVRRFNFLDYNQQLEEPNRQLAQLVINPEVTVRSRGVMEKCTFCVQRIQRVKIDAKNEARPIGDGEIMTACQQACPAQAIVFGDLNNPQSEVAAQHAEPRAYGMLEELNVKPRTRYLARVRNPHPDLVDRA